MNNGAVITGVGSQTEALAARMLDQVYHLLSVHGIIPNDAQQQMLASHVRAMAHRSVTGESLPGNAPGSGDGVRQPVLRLQSSAQLMHHLIAAAAPDKHWVF